MIAKIPKPGKSFGGCIQYAVLKKEAIALDAIGVRIDKVDHTIRDFNMQRKMNPGLGQAVGHISLSFSPNDKEKLSDEAMIMIAREYLQKMKIRDTQVLMVRHQDKAHLHIIYNRVDNQGKTIPDNFQRQRSIKICKQLTLAHGLYMAPGKEQVNRQALQGTDKVKYELFDAIKTQLRKISSLGELTATLAKQGIEVQFKYKSGTTEVQGISFGKGEYKFKGSEIDRSLSYGNITKSIADRMHAQDEQRGKEHQPKSLANQLWEITQKGYLDPEPETSYLKPDTGSYYLEHELETKYLDNVLTAFNPDIDISDDVDDEAIHGRNRRRTRQARTNTR